MIQCKWVYDLQESSDGYWVLVDCFWLWGIKKEVLVCDEWCKELMFFVELCKVFYGEVIDFVYFSQCYCQEFDVYCEMGLWLVVLV